MGDQAPKGAQVSGIKGKPVAQSGSAYKLDVLVKFYEYVELSSACSEKDHVPDTLLDQILEFHPQEHFTNKGPKVKPPKPVKDKWIYVFKKYSKGNCSLDSEAKVFEEDGKQKYKFVDWTEKRKSKWTSGKYPRDLGGKTDSFIIKLFSFDGSFETFVLLSHIQLTLDRIEFYRQHTEVLVKRALHISSGRLPRNLANSSRAPPPVCIESDEKHSVWQIPLVLVDFIGLARAFQQEFTDRAKENNEYVSDKIRAKKRYLADMIWGLCEKRSKMKRWVKHADLKTFRDTEDERLNRKHTRSENACGRKSSWMLKGGYVAMRDDYNGDEKNEKKIQEEEAFLSEGNIASRKGLEYLKKVAGNKDSWYYKYFFDDEPFQCWRKSITAGKEFAKLFSDFMQGRVAHHIEKAPKPKTIGAYLKITKKVQIDVIKDASLILAKRNIVVPKLETNSAGQYFWAVEGDEYAQSRIIRYKLRVEVEVKLNVKVDYTDYDRYMNTTVKDLEKKREAFSKLDNITGMILIPIEIFNLYKSLGSFADQYKNGFTLPAIEVAGAIADTLSSLEVLLAKKIADKLAFPIINVVGAICDYAVGVWKTGESFLKGKYGLAAGYATTALAATALGAAGALEISGVLLGSSTATAFGLSATAFGIIGAILFGVGVLLIYIFAEEPLEEWAEMCAWGTDSDFKVEDVDFKISERELSSQIRGLFEILTKFEVQCGYYEENRPLMSKYRVYDITRKGIALRIRLGMFDEHISKFVVKGLKIEVRKSRARFADWMTLAEESKLILPDNKCKFERWEGISNIDRVWTWEELQLKYKSGKSVTSEEPLRSTGKFECSVQLDFKGDGTEMYPNAPKDYEESFKEVSAWRGPAGRWIEY